MKTFAVAEWESDRNGDNILKELKDLGKTSNKLIKKRRPSKWKLKKTFIKQKAEVINSLTENNTLTEENASLNSKKRRQSKNKLKYGKTGGSSNIANGTDTSFNEKYQLQKQKRKRRKSKSKLNSANNDDLQPVEIKENVKKTSGKSSESQNSEAPKKKKRRNKTTINEKSENKIQFGSDPKSNKISNKNSRRRERKKEKAKLKTSIDNLGAGSSESSSLDTQVTDNANKKKRNKSNLSAPTAAVLEDGMKSPQKHKKKMEQIDSDATPGKKSKLGKKLKAALENQINTTATPQNKKCKVTTLREKMTQKLKAAKFRLLNEQIYTNTGKAMHKYFKENVEDFEAYHEGYKQQVSKWPLNPLSLIIKKINNMKSTYVIADFGCGEAELAKSVKQKVHSFDLLASNELVTACDMAHVPLANASVDVAVFCLSLMGTNLRDYLLEANRVLKTGALLKIAEVESRFQSVESFVKGVEKLGFVKVWKDLSHNLFYFLDFKKVADVKMKKAVPEIKLQPCLYKKR